jgi:uncharacterized phage protein (TIGR01671 family)
MREIKFRVINKDGLIIGYEMFNISFGWHQTILNDRPCDDGTLPVRSGVIVDGIDNLIRNQYTGRKDKNDREVFEGDIYRIEEETDGLDEVFYVVVVWIHEWSMFASLLVEEYNRYKVGGVKELDEPLFWTYTLDDINSSKHFHCGNIYENPDLLKC